MYKPTVTLGSGHLLSMGGGITCANIHLHLPPYKEDKSCGLQALPLKKQIFLQLLLHF